MCDKNVYGIRYKCLDCVDYDLCSKCEKTGVHTNHVMVRLGKPKIDVIFEITYYCFYFFNICIWYFNFFATFV